MSLAVCPRWSTLGLTIILTFGCRQSIPPSENGHRFSATIVSTPVTTATEDSAYSYDVNATDVDAGDTLTYALTTAPTGMTINATTGMISWTPTNAQVGANSVTVRVRDVALAQATQTFTVTVANTNDAPTITSTPVTTGSVGAAYTYDVNATDPDVGDTLTYALTAAPTGMTINASTGVISWTPTLAQVGAQSVSVRVRDVPLAQATQTFSIQVSNTNHAPTATNDNYSVTVNTVLNVPVAGVLANDTDSDGDTLTAVLVSGPSHGTLTLNSNGSFAYTPAANFTGSDSFSYKARDGQIDSNVATVSLTVSAITAQLPNPPQTFDVPFSLPTGGATVFVRQSDNLQAALDNASMGDVIVLEAGATFTGPFKLPVKAGSGWVYIISSDLNQLPAEHNRVVPTDAAHMPKLLAFDDANKEPALFVNWNAHHYRFVGIEFRTNSATWDLVRTGQGLPNYSDPLWKREEADSVDELPHHLVFDRCYFQSTVDDKFLNAGINLNGSYMAVIDSYFSNIKSGPDSQAICIYNGPGPYKIVNNYLEATGENIMSGGTDPTIAGLIPADLEITNNFFSKRPEWNPHDATYNGYRWTNKNLLELKNAERVLISGNVFENSFGVDGGQRGSAIVLTPRNQDGGAPWSTVRDVAFVNNIIRHTANGVRISGTDDLQTSGQTKRVLIQNNLFEDISRDDYAVNYFLDIGTPSGLSPITDLTVRNNMALFGPHGEEVGSGIVFMSGGPPCVQNFIFENNVVQHGNYGVFGDAVGEGTDALNCYTANLRFTGNIVISRAVDRTHDYDLAHFDAMYPSGNWIVDEMVLVGFEDYTNGNYRLRASSPYKNRGTDGHDPSPNYDILPKLKGQP